MMSSRRPHIPGAAKEIGGKIMFNTLSHQLVCLEHTSHILGESSFSLSLCSCLTPQNRDLEQHTRRGELELAIISMDLYFSFGCGWGGDDARSLGHHPGSGLILLSMLVHLPEDLCPVSPMHVRNRNSFFYWVPK